MVRNGYEKILILEDDANFEKYFQPVVSDLMQQIENKNVEWDLL